MNSPIKWVGGKGKEIKNFEKYIPKNINEYCEPFLGGGSLYWYLKPRIAYLGDINEHLINFYNVLKDNPSELSQKLLEYENTKDFFNNIVTKLNNKTYKDKIEQASIFYYLNKTAFSGKWRLNSKGFYNNTFANYNRGEDYYKKIENINEYSYELNNSAILFNCDYTYLFDLFKNCYNGFMFLDPPYLDCDTMYTANQEFSKIYEDIYNYFHIANCKIMMVCKNTEYIENLFSEYIIGSYGKRYEQNGNSNNSHKHIIVCNYKIDNE